MKQANEPADGREAPAERSRAAESPPVAVLGLGNVLMGDDAIGPHVIAHLRAGWEFPPDVTVEDLGTPGLDLHPHLAGRQALVLIDAVRDDGAAGQVRRYDRDGLLALPLGPRLGPHDPGLLAALLALEFAGGAPREVALVGVIPGPVEPTVGLSAPVRAAIPAAAAAVVEELTRLGWAPRPRSRPLPPDLWWERPPPQEAQP